MPFNGMKSCLQNLTCVVRQGCVFCRKLLILHISCTCIILNIIGPTLYAHDKNIFYKHQNIDMMCKIVSVELDKLSKWFALTKLSLNISTSNFIIL